MKERNGESFDLDGEFLVEAGGDQDGDLDRLIVERRPPKASQRRPAQQSAWSRVEDALAERRLRRELSEFADPDEI
ncbi:MAG: hypothetical protein FJ191_12320 [Gammaproteobacteria bacterium]|nr:hypothetical protein [Gammaproteobacteria bacterium]